MDLLLLAHLSATLYMTGLIFFVQVVHYPLMAKVGNESFAAYETAHVNRTGWVVLPAMLLEAGTAIALLIRQPRPAYFAFAVAVLVGIWLVTFLLSVPCHNTLSQRFDPAIHRRLVATNWFRTIGWSLRSLYLLWLVTTLPQLT